MSSVSGPGSSPAAMGAAVEIEGVSHRYGRTVGLRDVSLTVPTGSVTALLGPNGAGKSTLLRAAVGLLAADSGRIRVLGTPVEQLTPAHRTRIGYVAESQALPGHLTLAQYERWLAPLYPRWDHALADTLRARFALDPSRRLRTYSRGQRMQAALLCALAPRPDLLVMDEPFAGLDAAIKDDLVRGVLELSGTEGWTVVIASHDLAELELLVDQVAFLRDGRLLFADPVDTLRARFRWADVHTGVRDVRLPSPLPADWVRAEVAGQRVRVLLRMPHQNGAPAAPDVQHAALAALQTQFPGATRLALDEPTLTDVFVGLAREGRAPHAATEGVA